MKRSLIVLLSLIIFMNSIPIMAQAEDAVTAHEFSNLVQQFASDYAPGGIASVEPSDQPLNRLIVKTNSNEPLKNDYGARAKLEGYDGIHILQYGTEMQTKTALASLMEDDIVYAEYDVWVSMSDEREKKCYCADNPADDGWCRCPDDEDEHGYCCCIDETAPDNHLSWNSSAVQVEEAFDLIENSGIACSPITVAVFDTGLFVEHSYFDISRIEIDEDYTLTLDGVSYNTREDGHYHGTHVAGIIYDNTMSEVKLCPYRVYGDSFTWIPYSVFYAAIKAAIENEVDVINISSIQKKFTSSEEESYSPGESFNDILNEATNKGIVIVSCAGNSYREVADDEIPASFVDGITVSATTRENLPDKSYSNFGDYVDIGAPGTDIYSTVPIKFVGGEEYTNCSTYMRDKGTSMAAPLVAAAAATLKSINPDFTPAEIEKIIKETAYVPEDWDIRYGAGIVNFYNMVKEAIKTKPEIILNKNDKFEILPIVYSDATYYTLDGSEPTAENGELYTESLDLSKKSVSLIKAASFKNGEQIGDTAFYRMTWHESVELYCKESVCPLSENFSQKVKWQSKDPGVATVDRYGNITGLTAGETQVVAKLSSGRRIIYDVTVEYTWWQWLIKILSFGFIRF